MSRLIDKLTKIRQIEPQPMGFAVSKPTSEKPRMQLLASSASQTLGKLEDGLRSADAVIIKVTKSDDIEVIDKVCQEKDAYPSGGWLQFSDNKIMAKLKDTVCDFVVFNSDSPLITLEKDKMGRVLELDASLTEGLLRTANDLPVDAVLVSGLNRESPITFNHLMQIQRVAYLINKPILVEIPMDLSGEELQALWDTGIAGVIVELVDKKSVDKFTELREAIGKLSPAAALKRSRMRPVLPHLQTETPAPEQGGEEEDE